MQAREANTSIDKDNIYNGFVGEALNQPEHDDCVQPKAGHCSPPCCGIAQANHDGGAHDEANNNLSLLFFKRLQVDTPQDV